MTSLGTIYAAVVVVLLFVALGLAVPVLKGIVVDGLERRRKWKTGEMERDTERSVDRGPPAVSEDKGVSPRTCPQCGAENDPQFSFCSRCTAPL